MSSNEDGLLSDYATSCWSGAELEFLAEEEFIFIRPNFSQAAIPLALSKPVGPFKPPLPVEVPLWMALQLKKQRRCDVVCPSWLSVSRLEQWLEKESSQDL